MGRPIFLSHKKSEEEVESSENVHVVHNDRVIFLSGTVEEDPISTAILAILQMLKKDPTKPITLMISTYGGSLVEMFALYDIVQYAQSKGCQIITIGLGKIMSAGVILLVCGNKGLRKIAKHATVMIHPAYEMSSSNSNYFELKNTTEELKRVQDLMNKLMIKHTNMSQEDIDRIIANRLDTYLDAEQAIKLGIADTFIGDE